MKDFLVGTLKDLLCLIWLATRHLVFMTYLNTVNDGGETEWFHQQIKIQPRKGLTVMWPVDWTHVHRGVPSKTETKYITTGWYTYKIPNFDYTQYNGGSMNLNYNYWYFQNAFTPEQCDRIIKMGMQEDFEYGEVNRNRNKLRVFQIIQKKIKINYLRLGILTSHG